MLSEIPYLFLYLLILINALAFIGIIVLNPYKKYFKNKSLYLFAALSIGLTLTIVITSLAVTNFKTVNFILVLIGIYIFYTFLKNKNNYVNQEVLTVINRKTILYLFVELNICASILFLLYYLLLSYKRTLFIGLPHIDTCYYSMLSKYLITYHTETRIYDFAKSIHPSPYHYFDIWFNSFINLFYKNSLLNMLFVSFPCSISILYFGFKAILSEVLTKKKYLIIPASIFAFSYAGLYITNLYKGTKLMDAADCFSISCIIFQKLFPIYLFLVWAIYFLKHNKIELFFLFLSLIAVSFISTVVPLSIFAFIILVVAVYKKQNIVKNSAIKLLAVNFLVFAFYYLLANKSEAQLTQIQDIHSYFSLPKLKTGINVIVKTLIQVSLLCFFIIAIFLFNYQKGRELWSTYKFEIYILCTLFLSALISWAFLSQMFDAIQLFMNLAVPLLNIVGVIFIFHLVNNLPDKKYIMFILIGIVFIFNTQYSLRKVQVNTTFSEPALLKFKTNLYPKIINKRVVYLKSKKYFNSIFSISSDAAIIGTPLLLIDNFEFVSLSVFETPLSTEQKTKDLELMIIQSSIFYKYVSFQKSNNRYKSIEKSKVDYSKENKIQLLITTQDIILPNNIKSMIVDSVNDDIAKQNYYLLKP